jgi:hypothetical protein
VSVANSEASDRAGASGWRASLGATSTATSRHHALREQIARARGVLEARLIIEARNGAAANDTPDIAAMRQALAALEGATAALRRIDARQDRSGEPAERPSLSQAPTAP